MSQNCKRFHCNQTKKIKKIPPDLRNKKGPLDVSVKVWKELIKAYYKVDALRNFDMENTQVFKFAHKIILNSLNNFYILLVHNEIELLYVSGQGHEC